LAHCSCSRRRGRARFWYCCCSGQQFFTDPSTSSQCFWNAQYRRRFIDTNILVYADDAFDPRKQQLALELLVDLRARQEAVLSTQVLQEYFVTATRKLGLEAHFARQRVTQFGRFELIQPTLDMLLAAMDLQQNHSLSFWDALIVQTASAARCGVLYSEDMQAGARIGNVLIVNPFT
jgi:predicted nucleic acid-binding protein